MKKEQPYQVHRWTRSAIECYLRGCVCKGCPLHELIFKNYSCGCQMKKSIIELVRVLGIPDELKNKKNIMED